MICFPERPWRVALYFELLPSGVFGPVECWALLRLANLWRKTFCFPCLENKEAARYSTGAFDFLVPRVMRVFSSVVFLEVVGYSGTEFQL